MIHEIRLYGELHRFVPVLAAARGFRVGETPVEHRPRQYGRSKYGWSRIPKGLLDLLTVQFITRFGQRPQHWLGSVGLVVARVGHAWAWRYLAIVWVWSRMPWQPAEAAVHLHEPAGAVLLAACCVLIRHATAGHRLRGRDDRLARLARPRRILDRRVHRRQARAGAAPRPASPRPQDAPMNARRRRDAATAHGRVRRADRAGRGQHDRPAAGGELGEPRRAGAAPGLAARGGAGAKSCAPKAPTTKRSPREVAEARPQIEAEERRQRPFLSANDRSRWLTIRALVDHGTFAIDDVIDANVWNTIDMVQHRGRDGELHLYSSKPPLLSVLLAGEYWLIQAVDRLDARRAIRTKSCG